MLTRRYPSEIEADFTQYFHLSLEDLGSSLTLRRAGLLATQLPYGSRIARALNPSHVWDWQEVLLANIANSLKILVWSKTEDGQKGQNFPDMFTVPGQPNPIKESNETEESWDIDEYRAQLERPRAEIQEEGGEYVREHD